jgi:anthranilate synthase component I
MFYPDIKEFKKLSKKYNLIPVYKEILADMETPVSAFHKISQKAKYAYLLESVEGGEKLGRYSFISADPSMVFESQGYELTIRTGNKTEKVQLRDKDPLAVMQTLLKDYRPVHHRGLPRFYGGAVGYIGYDMVRFFEPKLRATDCNPDELQLPDMVFMFTDTILIFDHVKHTIKVVSCAHVNGNADKVYKAACAKVEELINTLRQPVRMPAQPKRKTAPLKMQSNFTPASFKKMVLKAKEYIKAGDIIQVVPSQRFSVKVNADAFTIYRALRRINPSSYMYFLKCADFNIVGTSPEILVRKDEELVEVRPIAGTRPRGATDEEDDRLAKELLADPKERAEHIMLVDLGRNDIGRVCDYHTVKVPELMVIEKYSHVQHIVSDVVGRISKGKDCFDVLRACFPAGTVSGAPKIRAMEIIDELEPVKRGLYAGCIGYFSFSGNLDACIAIRTAVVKDGKAYVQAGGGIVADSVPETEYQETINKAKAMVKAIEMAEEGLE